MPHIERPWAYRGDYWELLVSDTEDWVETMARMPDPTPEERIRATQRYIERTYSSITDPTVTSWWPEHPAEPVEQINDMLDYIRTRYGTPDEG